MSTTVSRFVEVLKNWIEKRSSTPSYRIKSKVYLFISSWIDSMTLSKALFGYGSLAEPVFPNLR